VKWEEVDQAFKKKDADLLVFDAGQVLDRVQKMGDLFEPVRTLKQKLPKLDGITKGAAPEDGLELAAQVEDSGPKISKKSTKPARRSAAKKKSQKV
jgi:hypothetical protein